MRRFAWAVFAAALWGAQACAAEGIADPFELYRAGYYEAAIAAGETNNDAMGLAVAARAALADANLRDTPCLACLKRAEGLARRSLALDASRPEAFIYLAASLGYQARIIGSIRARFANFPEQTKDAIDTALSLAPNDSWSLAASGGWHIEVVRIGGFLARPLYGARVETGRDFFRRAIAADPENPVIRFQYALSLSGYDFDAYKNEALSELESAVNAEPRTAYEHATKIRAARLLELGKENRQTDYLALVNRYQGYP